METKVFVVTEYSTPYKHNNVTPRERTTLFANLHTAVDFIRGCDGGQVRVNTDRRVAVWLKDGCKPEYEIITGIDGILFQVKEECIYDAALKQGGYVYRVRLEEKEIMLSC